MSRWPRGSRLKAPRPRKPHISSSLRFPSTAKIVERVNHDPSCSKFLIGFPNESESTPVVESTFVWFCKKVRRCHSVASAGKSTANFRRLNTKFAIELHRLVIGSLCKDQPMSSEKSGLQTRWSRSLHMTVGILRFLQCPSKAASIFNRKPSPTNKLTLCNHYGGAESHCKNSLPEERIQGARSHPLCFTHQELQRPQSQYQP
ncbi:hypothetical protein IWX90DRAFT_438060 [Phyllosticta citrichinensis]|uniref:Uncharacterized protein n=1 Tax=Phyllosticta citrichinensis TaxID=1130410 RepID=A0ABR1XN53_9PEZI